MPCFFVVIFFSLRHEIEKLRNNILKTMTTNWSNEVFTCWSRVLSWWWLTLSCTDRAGSHDESRDFAYKTLWSVVLYFNVFGLRSPGALWRKRAKYLQTHIQVVLIAANPHWKMLLSGNFGTDWVANAWKPWKPWMPCMLSMPMS